MFLTNETRRTASQGRKSRMGVMLFVNSTREIKQSPRSNKVKNWPQVRHPMRKDFSECIRLGMLNIRNKKLEYIVLFSVCLDRTALG